VKALLIGLGEIGTGMKTLCEVKHALQIYDPAKGHTKIDDFRLKETPVLLVAIPWSNDFITDVRVWQNIMKDFLKATIIFSTVPVGTCAKLDAVHFPVEAKHPYIARDLKINQHCYMGGDNMVAKAFMEQADFHFECLEKPEFTEFLKLRSTTIYGVNIEFARYTKEVCDKIGLDFAVIKQYDIAHNELCKMRGTPEHARYILDAPDGAIGGHCVVPNAKIIHEQFPNNLVSEIIANSTDLEEEEFTGHYIVPIMRRNAQRVKINARGLQWRV
jgi:hypothetical protein